MTLLIFVAGVLLGAGITLHIGASRRHLPRASMAPGTPHSNQDTNLEWFNQLLGIVMDYLLDKVLDSRSILQDQYKKEINTSLESVSRSVNAKVTVGQVFVRDTLLNVESIAVPRSPQRTDEKRFRLTVTCEVDCEVLLLLSKTLILSFTVKPVVHRAFIKSILDVSLMRSYSGLKITLNSPSKSVFDISWSVPVGLLQLSSESAFLNLTKGILAKAVDTALYRGVSFTIPLPVDSDLDLSPPQPSVEEVEVAAGIGHSSVDESVDTAEERKLPWYRRGSIDL
ncbi:hypothetical protein P9112_011972 [Eukaryota sp. TZLM1-RC]